MLKYKINKDRIDEYEVNLLKNNYQKCSMSMCMSTENIFKFDASHVINFSVDCIRSKSTDKI